MLGLLEKNAHAPDFFQRLVAGVARGAKDVVEAVGKVPSATLEVGDNNHPLGETYHTQACPVRRPCRQPLPRNPNPCAI